MTKTNTANETAPTTTIITAHIVYLPEGDTGRWLAVSELGAAVGLTQEDALDALQASQPKVTFEPEMGGRCIFAKGAFKTR